jgi:hypothetical protein
MVLGLLRNSLAQSWSWRSPLVKAVMASASVMLGMEFLVFEKRLMKSRREFQKLDVAFQGRTWLWAARKWPNSSQ